MPLGNTLGVGAHMYDFEEDVYEGTVSVRSSEELCHQDMSVGGELVSVSVSVSVSVACVRGT